MRSLFIKLRTSLPCFGKTPAERGKQAATLLRDLAGRLERHGLDDNAYFVMIHNGAPVGDAAGHAGMDEEAMPERPRVWR